MEYAIQFEKTGGPEVLQRVETDPGKPGHGEILVRHEAIGLNFIDTYHRSGLYPVPLPSGLGLEAAGVVEAVGVGVDEFQTGDRVAYCGAGLGAYSTARVVNAEKVVKLPEAVDTKTGAAIMLKGLTAWYLLRRTHPVKSGETVLVHAAAGGVGQFLVQWAKHLGATVIGTVGSEEKAALARDNGCDHTILYRQEDFKERVLEITNGAGVPVVYDSVGKATFEQSLDCLAPLGMMVSYGNASGAVPAFEPAMLASRGSLFFTRPTLAAYVAKREWLVAGADELFELVGSGVLKVRIGQTYPLKDAAQAHRDLEARKTTGSTLLMP